MNYVYALLDPRDLAVRYIGITDDPKSRFYAHLLPDRYNPGKTAWVQELKALDLLPIMLIIAEVETKREAHDLEMRIVHECLEQSVALLNVDRKRPFSHWTQVTGEQPILYYKVICTQDYQYWVVGVVDEKNHLYRLRDGHKAYTVDASAYAKRDKLNKQLKDEQIARDGAIIL